MTDGDRATFVVRALHGPPRPVLVLTVTGEVDRTNDGELDARIDRMGEVAAAAPSRHHRDEFGARSVAHVLVADLRAVTFIGGRALDLLAHRRDGAGEPIRLVVADGSVVRRALAALRPRPPCRLYTDLADAVLAAVDPTDFVSE